MFNNHQGENMASIKLDTDRMIINSRYLPSEIRHKPVLDISEQAALAGIPPTSLEKIYSEEDSPRLFMLGRHRKALMDDFMNWLKKRAETHPYIRQPSRNPYGRKGKKKSVR
jgi:hypothetical protein